MREGEKGRQRKKEGEKECEREGERDLHTLRQQPLHTTADNGVTHPAHGQLVIVQKLVNQQSHQGATLRRVNSLKAPQRLLHQ